MREALSRALNACLHVLNRPTVKFLFRLLRFLIFYEDQFDQVARTTVPPKVVYDEFIHQFSREFKCDAKEYERENTSRFYLAREWSEVRPYLEQMETGAESKLQDWFHACPDIPIGYLVKFYHETFIPGGLCSCRYCQSLAPRAPQE